MSERWYFCVEDDGSVFLRCRVEGEGGMIGDASVTVRPGEAFHGRIPYADLLAADRDGVVTIDDDGGYQVGGRYFPPPRSRAE